MAFRTVRVRLAAWGRLALLAIAGALALSAASQLTGHIQDDSGAAVPNARIEVLNQERGTRRSFEADAQVRFQVTLDAGTYTVRVELPGFKPVERRDVRLSENTSEHVSIIIPIGEPPPPKVKP